MKAYKIILIGLKLTFFLQFLAITIGFQEEENGPYLIMDFLFKFILGIFLMVFFHVTDIKQIRGWNARFIEFGGALLSYDAWYNSLPKALLKYNIYYDPYKFVIRRLDSTEIPTEKMAASIVA